MFEPTVISQKDFDKMLWKVVFWTLFVGCIYWIYSIFEPALVASIAPNQLEDSLVTYSVITRFIMKGGIDKVFCLVWVVGLMVLLRKIFFGKGDQSNEG